MNALNDYAPAIGGVGLCSYLWFMYFRIKREQVRSRKEREAAE